MGPLPPLYRWRTIAVVLLVCVTLGAWLAFSTPLPVMVTAGALLGGLAGVLLAYLLVHDFSARQPRPVRVKGR